MDCFNYPLDTETLLRKKRRLRKELLAQNPHPLQKRIAILGGSTTNEVADQLGLFLLQYGIQAEFYQSEYGQYWQDAMGSTPMSFISTPTGATSSIFPQRPPRRRKLTPC